MRNSETTPRSSADLPSGPAAAALLSAGIGSCTLAILAIAADRMAGLRHWMTFSKATGPLSGVTTSAVLAWLLAWALLELRWRNRDVPIMRICIVSIVLLIAGLLLTFPPIADAL